MLIGFSIKSSLERMIKWLSDTYAMTVNAVVLNYVKTKNGEELLTRTSIISEELEHRDSPKRKKFKIPMSDDPGAYEPSRLKQLLKKYLSRKAVTIQRIRDVLLPVLLDKKVLTREQLKKELIKSDPNTEESKVGFYLMPLSSQFGMKKNDFLRQVVSYEYPTHRWEKDNFSIREQYRDLIKEILDELKNQ